MGAREALDRARHLDAVHAARILGLSLQQRDVLFAGHWTVRALRAGVNALERSDGEIDALALTAVMQAEEIDWEPSGHRPWP